MEIPNITSLDNAIMETKSKLYEAFSVSGENAMNQIMRISTGWGAESAMSFITPILVLLQKIMMGVLNNKLNPTENIIDIMTILYNITESLGYKGMNSSSSSVSTGNRIIDSTINKAKNFVDSVRNITQLTITNAAQASINILEKTAERIQNKYQYTG